MPGCQDAGEFRRARVSLNAKGLAPRHGSCSSPPFPDNAGSSVPLDCAVGHVANWRHASEVGTRTYIRSSHWQRWSTRVPRQTCGRGRLQKKDQTARHTRHCFLPGPLGKIQDQIRILNHRPSFRIPGKMNHPMRGRRSQIPAPKLPTSRRRPIGLRRFVCGGPEQQPRHSARGQRAWQCFASSQQR